MNSHWRNRTGFFLLAGSLCIRGPLQADPSPPEVRLERGAERVGKYEKVEFLIRCELDCKNPFDPGEVDVSLELQAPGGSAITLPAFYCQDYERRALEREGRRVDWLYPGGPPAWKARFAPVELGRYTCAARVRNRGEEATSGRVSFECLPSARRGFLRVSAGDPRFLEFSDGEPFFAIGQNLAFIGPGQYVSPARAEEIFRRLAENGANKEPIPVGPPGFGRDQAAPRLGARRPPFGVGPPRLIAPLIRHRRSSLPGGLSLGLGPTDYLLG